MNLNLESRERWDATPIGGLYVHVVEGYECGNPLAACKVFPCSIGRHPEFKWVALSEQKCETCGGRGWTTDLPDDPGPRGFEASAPLLSCSDCFEGRPLVEVSVECPHCDGDGWLMGYDWSVAPEARVDANVEQIDCDICDAAGRLSIGKGTVEAVTAWIDGKFGVIVRRMS